MTSIVFLGNITTIESSAFNSCSSLPFFKIPETVTSIGSFAFRGCIGFSNFTIPQKVINISEGLFCECSKLETIDIPENINSIGIEAFYRCLSLKTIKIPEKVTTIENRTFFGCSKLQSVQFLGNLTSIQSFSFQNCQNLKSLFIPGTVKYIGTKAFNSCSNLNFVFFYGQKDVSNDATIFQNTQVNVIYVTKNYENDKFCELPVSLLPMSDCFSNCDSFSPSFNDHHSQEIESTKEDISIISSSFLNTELSSSSNKDDQYISAPLNSESISAELPVEHSSENFYSKEFNGTEYIIETNIEMQTTFYTSKNSDKTRNNKNKH